MVEQSEQGAGFYQWRSIWRDPAKVGAIIVFLASLSGNVLQFINNSQENRQKDRDFVAQQARWSEERKKLEQEIAKLEQEHKSSVVSFQQKERCRSELERVARDIAVWERGIFETQLQVTAETANVQRYQGDPNKPFMLQAAKDNLALTVQLLQTKQQELQASRSRRTELEACLR